MPDWDAMVRGGEDPSMPPLVDSAPFSSRRSGRGRYPGTPHPHYRDMHVSHTAGGRIPPPAGATYDDFGSGGYDNDPATAGWGDSWGDDAAYPAPGSSSFGPTPPPALGFGGSDPFAPSSWARGGGGGGRDMFGGPPPLEQSRSWGGFPGASYPGAGAGGGGGGYSNPFPSAGPPGFPSAAPNGFPSAAPNGYPGAFPGAGGGDSWGMNGGPDPWGMHSRDDPWAGQPHSAGSGSFPPWPSGGRASTVDRLPRPRSRSHARSGSMPFAATYENGPYERQRRGSAPGDALSTLNDLAAGGHSPTFPSFSRGGQGGGAFPGFDDDEGWGTSAPRMGGRRGSTPFAWPGMDDEEEEGEFGGGGGGFAFPGMGGGGMGGGGMGMGGGGGGGGMGMGMGGGSGGGYRRGYTPTSSMTPHSMQSMPGGMPMPMPMGGGSAGQRRPRSLSNAEGYYGRGDQDAFGYGGSGRRRRRDGRYERPPDWREDFRVRGTAVGGFLRRLGGTDMQVPQDNIRRSLSLFLSTPSMASSRPSITYDLRLPPHPTSINLPSENRPANQHDLMRFTHEPPLRELVLIHDRLPWYIRVRAQNPSGVMIHELLGQLYMFLQMQISQADYFNYDMHSRDREDLNDAWARRCRKIERMNGNMVAGAEGQQGIKKVDFLRGEHIFEGLKKANGGMWEFKTRPSRREERL